MASFVSDVLSKAAMTRSLEPIGSFVIIEGDSVKRSEFSGKKKNKAKPRILYAPGPGDVYGSYIHWINGRHEIKTPTAAYSTMFYELVKRLDADALVLSLQKIRFEQQESISFHFIRQLEAFNKLSYIRSSFATGIRIVFRAMIYRPKYIVISTHFPCWTWPLLAIFSTVILSCHNTFWPQGILPRKVRKKAKFNYLKFCARWLSLAVCTSAECARQISILTSGRAVCYTEVPQIVARYPLQSRARCRSILFLGRIEEDKGVFLLLHAFNILAPECQDLRLTFAGDGSGTGRLQESISNSNFKNRINYCGPLDSEGVHNAISAHDVIVCPTTSRFNEGLGLVGFEAAAHGIPAIVSSVVPASELLGESCSVFGVDDLNELVSSIAKLVENPDQYIRKCGATGMVRALIYDRRKSWGTCLAFAISKFESEA